MEDTRQTDRLDNINKEEKDAQEVREGFMVNLRSKKHKQAFMAKRTKAMNSQDENSGKQSFSEEINEQLLGEVDSAFEDTGADNLFVAMECLGKDDFQIQHYVQLLRYVRKTFSRFDPHKLGITLKKLEEQVPAYLAILQRYIPLNEHLAVQQELTWIYTNFASVNELDFLKELVNPHNGIIGYMNEGLSSETSSILDNVLHFFSNLIAEPDFIITIIENSSLIDFIKAQMNQETIKIKIARKTAWIISNIALHSSILRTEEKYREVLQMLVDTLCETLCNLQDEDINYEVVWGICSLVDNAPDDMLFMIYEKQCESFLVKQLHNERYALPAIRALGNLATSTMPQVVETLMANQFLHTVSQEYQGTLKPYRKELFWAISNVACSGHHFAERVANSEIFKCVLTCLKNTVYQDVSKEATWALCNTIESLTEEKRVALCLNQPEVIEVLAGAFKSMEADVKMLHILYVATDRLLSTGKDSGNFPNSDHNPIYIFQDAGAIETVTGHQTHPNQAIYDRSNQLLVKFYPSDDDQMEQMTL